MNRIYSSSPNALRARRHGQTLVEYALILAFISIVAILVLQALGTKVNQTYSTINSRIDTAMSASAG